MVRNPGVPCRKDRNREAKNSVGSIGNGDLRVAIGWGENTRARPVNPVPGPGCSDRLTPQFFVLPISPSRPPLPPRSVTRRSRLASAQARPPRGPRRRRRLRPRFGRYPRCPHPDQPAARPPASLGMGRALRPHRGLDQRQRRRIYLRAAPPGGMPRAAGGRLDLLGMCGLLPHHSAQLLNWTHHGVPYTIVARGAGTRGRAVTVSSTSGAARHRVGFGALFTDGVRATADGRIDSRKVPLTLDDNRRGALEGTAVLAVRRLSSPDLCEGRNRKPKPQSPMRAPRSRPPRSGAVWREEACKASG